MCKLTITYLCDCIEDQLLKKRLYIVINIKVCMLTEVTSACNQGLMKRGVFISHSVAATFGQADK